MLFLRLLILHEDRIGAQGLHIGLSPSLKIFIFYLGLPVYLVKPNITKSKRKSNFYTSTTLVQIREMVFCTLPSFSFFDEPSLPQDEISSPTRKTISPS